MTTESLIVELDARTQKLDAALKSTNQKLDKLDKQTNKNDKSFGKLSKTAGAVGAALKVTAVAGLALATALTAVVLKSAASQQELALLSRQAKLSTDDFEALAFATNQYGINAEQIADISKDLSDKMGEFGKVGTGAFQDFADIVGLTKEEAKAAAVEFENMSSDQVIGSMVSQMEKAGASGNEMIFVLESMGNDLSRLIPLFADGSKELKTMTDIFGQATKQMKLSNEEIEGLQGAATSFDLLNQSLGKSAKLISAQLAPALDEFFQSFIEVVPTATQVFVNFINTFRDASNIENIKSIRDEVTSLTEDIQSFAVIQQEALMMGATPGGDGIQSDRWDVAAEGIGKANDRIGELLAQEKKLIEQRKLADAERLSAGSITSTFGGGGGGSGGTGDEVQAIADRFKTEEELLLQKLNNDLVLIGENNELKLQLEQAYQDELSLIRSEAQTEALMMGDELRGLFEDATKQDLRDTEDANKGKVSSDRLYVGAALAGADALFEGNKAVDAGLVVTKTALAVMNQLSGGDPYTAFARAAAAGVAGAVQLTNVLSASKGGGSTSTPADSSGVTGDGPSTELSISDTDASGEGQSQIITLRIDSDDSDMAMAISGILSKAKVNGTIS
jgi:hypothetical protein